MCDHCDDCDLMVGDDGVCVGSCRYAATHWGGGSAATRPLTIPAGREKKGKFCRSEKYLVVV